MSLWYESLANDLYDCGENTADRVTYILAYLCMPTPRSWWQQAMQTGDVCNWAPVIRDLQVELSKSMDSPEQLNASLLVALAFIDDDEPQDSKDRFDNPFSHHTSTEYFARAKEALAKRPELARVGLLIEKAIEEEDPSSDS